MLVFPVLPAKELLYVALVSAIGCNGSPAPSSADASEPVDAQEPRASADAATATCGHAALFAPSQISGLTPYGDLDLEIEGTAFANGCGAMSMSISYVPVQEYGYRFTAKFALPKLEFPDGESTYSQPGTYTVPVSTSVCDLDYTNCFHHDAEGTVSINILADDENADPNTNLTLNIFGDDWNLSTLTVTGSSCSWVWNPC